MIHVKIQETINTKNQQPLTPSASKMLQMECKCFKNGCCSFDTTSTVLEIALKNNQNFRNRNFSHPLLIAETLVICRNSCYLGKDKNKYPNENF